MADQTPVTTEQATAIAKAAATEGDAKQQPQIDDHTEKLGWLGVVTTPAGLTALGSLLLVVVTQVTPLVSLFAKPGPVQVVNCPCAEKQAKPVLVDPAILTDDQKAKIKTNGPKS